MNDLEVPKRRVEVGVVLAGGERRRVTVFLAQASPCHAGAERLTDVLDGPEREFIPALDAESGEITFLRAGAVTTVEIAPEEEGWVGEGSHLVEHVVELSLADGRVLRGAVRYALPPARRRLTDFLSDGRRFLPLYVGGSLLLVNKREVTRVTPVER